MRYGDVKIVSQIKHNERNRELFGIKSKLYLNKKDFEQSILLAKEKQYALKMRSIVNLVNIQFEVNEYLCSNFYKLDLIYEFYGDSLEKSILYHKKQGILFRETDI